MGAQRYRFRMISRQAVSAFFTCKSAPTSPCGPCRRGRPSCQILPTPLDQEAAGFEEGLEAVGLVALDFDHAGFDFAAAAEGRFQFSQEVLQLCRAPCGGESFEDEDSFAAAVRGGTAKEDAFLGFFFRRRPGYLLWRLRFA